MFKYENFVSVKNFRKNINFLKKYYSIVNCFDMFNDEIKNSDKKIFLIKAFIMRTKMPFLKM